MIYDNTNSVGRMAAFGTHPLAVGKVIDGFPFVVARVDKLSVFVCQGSDDVFPTCVESSEFLLKIGHGLHLSFLPSFFLMMNLPTASIRHSP